MKKTPKIMNKEILRSSYTMLLTHTEFCTKLILTFTLQYEHEHI